MLWTLLLITVVGLFVYQNVLRPRRQKIHLLALLDVDRIARLANIDSNDILIRLDGTYRVSWDNKWRLRYRFDLSYRDLSTLVGGDHNPFVNIARAVEVDEMTNRRQLEEQLAGRICGWTKRIV